MATLHRNGLPRPVAARWLWAGADIAA